MLVSQMSKIEQKKSPLNVEVENAFYRISFMDLDSTILKTLEAGLQHTGLSLYFTDNIDDISHAAHNPQEEHFVVTEHGVTEKLYSQLQARFNAESIVPYIVFNGVDAQTDTLNASDVLIKPVCSASDDLAKEAAGVSAPKWLYRALMTAIEVVSVARSISKKEAFQLIVARANSARLGVLEVAVSQAALHL